MRHLLAIAGMLLLAVAAAPCQTTLRYDLASGDHLVFHESIDRSVHGKDNTFATHAEFTNHLLVVADPQHPERWIIGAQRNRTAGQLLHSTTGGKDTTKADRKDFQSRLQVRGPAFAEANGYDRTALPSGPLSALREWTSQVLFEARELMPLAVEPVTIGSEWRGASLMGMVTRYAANESLHGQVCLRLDGEARDKSLTMKAWFCPSSGLLEKLEFDAKYPLFDADGAEKISFELITRSRGESPASWLNKAETQQAWVQMALSDPAIPVSSDALLAMLNSDDPHVQRRALALWYRRGTPAPSTETLARLLASSDVRVRTLTTLLAGTAANSRGLLDRAAKDDDFFVRRAATHVPSSTCALQLKGKTELPPGDYWMTLQAGPIPGWPFIVHVPEEYRDNGAFPAIVYLSGGAGRALDGMNGARNTEETGGYVLIYPQARRFWWDDASIAMMGELLREVKQSFAIDPARFYLTGMSNGGTGALLYATLGPDQFAAAAPLMGAGFDTPAKDKPLGENTSALPLLFVHGDQDPIVPMQSSAQAVERLKGMDRSAPVELILRPGKGHELSLDDNGGKVLPFFEKYERKPYPKKLHLRLRTFDEPRQYWIEVLDKSDGIAEVDAKIDANTITLKSKNIRKMRLRLRPEMFSAGDVQVVWNGNSAWQGSVPRDCAAIAATAPEGDADLGYTREVLLGGEPK